MKTRLQPLLPGRPGISRLRKEPASRVEKPGAGLQLLTTLTASELVRRNGMSRPLGKSARPARQQLQAQSLGALGDQRAHRRPQPVPVQSAQRTGSKAAQPAMHRGRVWGIPAQTHHRLPQADSRTALGDVRGASRLDHRPRVALAWSDLHGQDPHPPPATRTAAFRQRRLAVLHASAAWPARSPRHPSACINQRADGATRRTCNPLADRFAFDGRRLQGIIRDGDGSWDSTLSGSPRGTGARTPVPHFFRKAETLPLQPAPRKQLVHNRALMSMRSFVSSSVPPEPVRRVLPVSLRCHCQRARYATAPYRLK